MALESTATHGGDVTADKAVALPPIIVQSPFDPVEVKDIVDADGGTVDDLLVDFSIGLRNRGRTARNLVQQICHGTS